MRAVSMVSLSAGCSVEWSVVLKVELLVLPLVVWWAVKKVEQRAVWKVEKRELCSVVVMVEQTVFWMAEMKGV